jgi:hypothetical protein
METGESTTIASVSSLIINTATAAAAARSLEELTTLTRVSSNSGAMKFDIMTPNYVTGSSLIFSGGSATYSLIKGVGGSYQAYDGTTSAYGQTIVSNRFARVVASWGPRMRINGDGLNLGTSAAYDGTPPVGEDVLKIGKATYQAKHYIRNLKVYRKARLDDPANWEIGD